MDNIYIGKIVSTHGIKGEIKILSDFDYKEKAFLVDTPLMIDNESYIIKSYRVHKNYDMVTLEGFTNINDVLFLMKKKVYKKREDLHLDQDQVLDQDLINFLVVDTNGNRGTIKEIFYASPTNKILRVYFEKEVLIPISSPMIKKINVEKKEIEVELMEGMI